MAGWHQNMDTGRINHNRTILQRERERAKTTMQINDIGKYRAIYIYESTDSERDRWRGGREGETERGRETQREQRSDREKNDIN